jgi:hypothetical protein
LLFGKPKIGTCDDTRWLSNPAAAAAFQGQPTLKLRRYRRLVLSHKL